MEADAISATIKVLVQNLINICKDEILLIRGLQKNAEKLRITFSVIQSYLEDAQTKSINEAAVKTWLKELEAKVFDADNVFDELNYQILAKKVASCFPSFYHCVHRRRLALRINEINTIFESINKSAMELGLQEKLAAAPASVSDASLETDSFTVDPIFIGRDDDVLKIVKMLMSPTKEAVSIIPIVGMGGLGKTTLARNVFNHQRIKAHFEQHIWVHVSRDFDVGLLLKKILVNLKPEKVEVENSNREDLLKNLQETLKAQTYVLVLDDVWNEDQQKWEDFIKSWSGVTSTKGNGIMVTTRNARVGSLVETLDMHLLNDLSEEDCWSIIKDRAFEGESITPVLEDVGKSIANRCKGLPLAANVVGGVLRGKSQEEWFLIKENWLSDAGADENYVSRILKLSFHHLPSPSLKKCFSYCSVFPKGARIDREQLIQLWMAEGYLQSSQTSDMETVGNQFLKVLLHNSLLQVVDRDEYDEVKHCSMHDLVHDVAGSVSDGIYYKRDESSQTPKEQEKQYTCWGCNGDESIRIPKDQAKCLRTLFYNDRISDIIFSDFKSLHALTLADDDVETLPVSIGELIHLRYLDISDTSITYLPDSVGELYHLQTIRAYPSRWSGLKKLPSALKYLCNLRHLYMVETTKLPSQLGMLTSLQTLSCFEVLNKDGHRIVELGSLKNLKGELKIYNLDKVQGEEESEKAYLFQKAGIVRLVLRWPYGSCKGRLNAEEVLRGLQPHPNIKMLHIDGFNGAHFPRWTSKMAVFLEGRWAGLNKLMEIRLERCIECEEIPALGQLPHLKSLYLRFLENVRSIGASFYGIEECNGIYQKTISVFPALERLELLGMQNLMVWEEVKVPTGAQVEVFPCLEYLMISGCRQFSTAPSQFTSLKELVIHDMYSGLPLASICGVKLKTLKRLEIVRIEGLIHLPDALFDNNQHLSMLEIRYCHNLMQLSDGMHSLTSLEELKLSDCINLESIPFSVSGGKLQSLTSLRKLSFRSSPKLINLLGEMEGSCVSLLEDLRIDGSGTSDYASLNKAVDGILRLASHSLVKLHLRGSENWKHLPDQLQHLTSLTILELNSFGIHELPEWLGNLSSLQELRLYNIKWLRRLPSVEATRRLTKLTTLDIQHCRLNTTWISHLPNVKVDWNYIRNGGFFFFLIQ